MYATMNACSPAAMILLGWYGGRPVSGMGDVAATSKATYGPTVGSPIAGLAAVGAFVALAPFGALGAPGEPCEPFASSIRRLCVRSASLARESFAHFSACASATAGG